MRIWFDTEFIEDGRTIDLLSIGLVREDGETLYLESAEADHSLASAWVRANVLSKLTGKTTPRAEIAKRVREFAGSAPEFWAYYADYDWVVLCQLYGRMIDLPDGWPKFCRDFKQHIMGDPSFELRKLDKNSAHDALVDAVWLRQEFLRFEEEQKKEITK